MRLQTRCWGLATAIVALIMCAPSPPVVAEPRSRSDKHRDASSPTKPDTKEARDAAGESKGDKTGKNNPKDRVKTFDFNALDLNGRMRTPQLLYFLERANEELERASLNKRSFIPHMVRSVEAENL